MQPLERLLIGIEQLLKQKERIVVAIDGMSAAGKSSFADKLAKQYASSLIHMDHFFLRPEQRTPERLNMPGGNIDFERFLAEVSGNLFSGRSFTYRPYDCRTQRLAEPVAVEPEPLIIIEGVYCMTPEITGKCKYDITVFMHLDEAEQRRRLMERNAQLYERFVSEWIPMENKYFKAFDIPGMCDHIIENSIY